jgi:hypothetical protein
VHTAQLGGPIGPLSDPATGQQVAATAQGRFTYQCAGDPSAVLPQLQAALLQSTTRVLQQKLSANQVALPTIASSLPYFVQEIVAQSGAAAMGVQMGQLELGVQVQAPQPAIAPYTGPLPPDPQTQMQNRMQQIASERLDPSNYNVRAKIKVGGFNINASSDGGIDTDGLANQVKAKAKSEIIWYGIGCAILGVVVLALAGLGFYIWSEAKSGSSAATTPNKATSGDAEDVVWDGKSEFSCGGSKNVRIKGVTAKLDSGTAINASGGCRVELVNCDITAPVGIQALANAVVVVKGGKVNGKDAAAKALGNAKVTFEGTAVTGKKSALGAAKIEGP